GVDGDVVRGPAGGTDTGEQLPDDRLAGPPAEVLGGLLDRDALRPLAGDAADAPERVVGAVAGRADDRGDLRGASRRAAGDPFGDVEDGGDAGLVVGE